jgi:GT2 family glycosyltransferase
MNHLPRGRVFVPIVFGEYERLATSGLFDAAYYIRTNPDIAGFNIDPLMHYLETGCREGRNPSADFDTPHYLRQCKAIGEAPTNALHHYLTVGAERGLTPKAHTKQNGRQRGARHATTKARNPETHSADTSNNAAAIPDSGYIDICGYSSAAGGWIFSGWVPRPPNTDQREPVDFVAKYEQSHNTGRATLAFYQRGDLDHKSIGVIAYLPSSSRVLGNLQHIAFVLDGIKYQAQAVTSTLRLNDQELGDRVRPSLLNEAFANRSRDQLLALTARRGFAGQDTLSSLTEPVLLEIDEAISCPPGGVFLKGWLLSASGAIRKIRVRSGPLAGELVLSESIRIVRPDVIAAVGPQFGFSEVQCGFEAYVPAVISNGDVCYVEIELNNGEVGFKKFKMSNRSGIDAIRRIVEGISVRYGEMNPAFDKVLGPALSSINSARLGEPALAGHIEFGEAPTNPKCTLIIPLYGRVDFVEYQMAFFSRHTNMKNMEIIYVLDDPTKRRELEVVAQSVFERFRIPFRLLLLRTNLGFAPASNVGLRAARGQFICFLNSDIFPITEDWIECLTEQLTQNQDIGIIAAQLLFDDGSVQHEGCFYRTIPEFGNWTFIEHHDKGRRPSGTRGLKRCDALTGACMLMKRSLIMELHGFDEAFIIGDFEDSDLCLRVKERGLSCAVDRDVHLYHLERKSQTPPSESWRMNLTLYNAWLHQRRWFDASKPGQTPQPQLTSMNK